MKKTLLKISRLGIATGFLLSANAFANLCDADKVNTFGVGYEANTCIVDASGCAVNRNKAYVRQSCSAIDRLIANARSRKTSLSFIVTEGGDAFNYYGYSISLPTAANSDDKKTIATQKQQIEELKQKLDACQTQNANTINPTEFKQLEHKVDSLSNPTRYQTAPAK